MRSLLVVPLCLVFAAACAPRGGAGDPGDDGLPGGPGESGPAPRIDAVDPPAGSSRNLVLITGTNFGAVASENEVRFAGELAEVLEANPTALTVAPPAVLDAGFAPVTVTRGQRTSASVGFSLVEPGTRVGQGFALPQRPGKPVEPSPGVFLVPDGLGSILRIDAAGSVSVLGKGQGLVSPKRLILGPDGVVVVFDPGAGGVFRIDPDTGLVEVEHWGSAYPAGSYDAAGNLFVVQPDGNGVDRLGADGSFSADWCVSGLGGLEDLQVLGTDLYAAANGASPALERCSTSTQGPTSVVTAAGVDAIRSLAGGGTSVLAAGRFAETNGQEGVVAIADDGTITAITTDPAGESRYGSISGAIALQNGNVLIADDGFGFVGELAGAVLEVRAAGVGNAAGALRIAGASYASVYNGTFPPGWITEIRDDGTTRVLAQGDFGQIATGDDDTGLLAVRVDAADVARIALAGGAATPVFPVDAELSSPFGLARDVDGYHYVSSPSGGVIAKYDPAGVVVAPAFATSPGAAGLSLTAGQLYVAVPSDGRADRVNLVNGDTSIWLAAGAGVAEPSGIFLDPDPNFFRILVGDATGGQVYAVDDSGFVDPFGPPVEGATTLIQRADRMLQVCGANGVSLLAP